MNREIKFRVWDKYIGKMFKIIRVNEELNLFCFQWGKYLMQYTGLRDKNGKEIYEGDILNQGYGFKPFVIKDIRLDTIKIARMIKFKQEHKNAVEIEVIGNIYENPELLNDKGVKNE